MATPIMKDEGSMISWAPVAALTATAVLTSMACEDAVPFRRVRTPPSYSVSVKARDMTFHVTGEPVPSSSVFGATPDAPLHVCAPLTGAHVLVEGPESAPIYVVVAARTFQARARVRAVDRSVTYDGPAFERGDDDDAS